MSVTPGSGRQAHEGALGGACPSDGLAGPALFCGERCAEGGDLVSKGGLPGTRCQEGLAKAVHTGGRGRLGTLLAARCLVCQDTTVEGVPKGKTAGLNAIMEVVCVAVHGALLVRLWPHRFSS